MVAEGTTDDVCARLSAASGNVLRAVNINFDLIPVDASKACNITRVPTNV